MSREIEREQARNNPAVYANYNDFMFHAVPFENMAAYRELRTDFEGIHRSGFWDAAMAERCDQVYTAIRGHSLFDDDKHELYSRRSRVNQAIRGLEYFAKGVDENIEKPNFDIDTFQAIYIRAYTELGARAAKWIARNYDLTANSDLSPWEYYQAAWQTVQKTGRELGSYFTTGFRKVHGVGVAINDFSLAASRIKEKHDKGAVKTFVLQAGTALRMGYTLDSFEAFVSDNCERFGADINYWLVKIAFQMKDLNGDYDLETLATDVESLKNKYGERTALWFTRGALDIIQTENFLRRRVEKTQKPEILTETTDEEWAESTEGFKKLFEDINYAKYRENFGQLLTVRGAYAADLYAFARTQGILLWYYPGLPDAINNYIDNVGVAFAKKSFWLISQINGGIGSMITHTFDKISMILEYVGEEEAISLLRYSYGASKHGRSPSGLVFPKQKNGSRQEEPKENYGSNNENDGQDF